MMLLALIACSADPTPVGQWEGVCDVTETWMGSPDTLALAIAVEEGTEGADSGDGASWAASATATYTYSAEGSGTLWQGDDGSVSVDLDMTATDYCGEADTNCSGGFGLRVEGMRDRNTIEGTCFVDISGGYGYAPAPGGEAAITLER